MRRFRLKATTPSIESDWLPIDTELGDATGELAVLGRDSLSWRFRAELRRPAFLVLAQPHYPGWRARIDGREVPLLRANAAFSAVELPAGSVELEIAYEPGSFRTGVALAALAVALLAFAAFWNRTRSESARALAPREN